MALGILRIDRLFRLPGDLTTALRVLPSIAAHTASLPEMARRIALISEDTRDLPPLRKDMGRVAEFTSLLPEVDERLRAIGEAMPVLVEVQRHLDQLPQTMAGLDDGIDRLSLLLEQMLPTMDALGADVASLRDELGPVSRLASRVPGQRRPLAT